MPESRRSSGLGIEPAAPTRSGGWSTTSLVPPAIIAVELILMYALLSSGGWVYDDNFILIEAGRSGLSWDWLTSLIFQHWGIGYHLIASVVHRLMPLDNRWALIAMLALLGGATYLLKRIVSLLFGSEWLAVGAAAFLGFSVLLVRGLQWWAGGLQYFPNLFFDLVCLYGYLRFLTDGSRRWAIASAGGLAGGLLFYEKPAYMLLYLALLHVLFFSADLRPRGVLSSFWRTRFVWAVLIVVTLVWAVGFHESGGGSGVIGGGLPLAKYLIYFRILWAQTLIPGLIGVTLPASGMSGLEILLAVVLQVVVIVGIGVSLWRKPSAWRAWVFVLVTFVITGVVVASARVAEFGVGIANDPRYLIDFTWLIPIAVCFAFIRAGTAWPKPPHEIAGTGLALPTSRRGRLYALAGGLSLIGYLALGIMSTAALQRSWPGHVARGWETRLQHGLGRIERTGRRPVIADSLVPEYIVQSSFVPLDRLSWVVPLYDRRAQVDGPLDGPLVTVSAAGAVQSAVMASMTPNRSAASLSASRALRVGGGGLVNKPKAEICISTRALSVSIERRIGRLLDPAETPLYLRLEYSSSRAAVLRLFVDSGTGYSRATDRILKLAAGHASSIVYLVSVTPRRLLLWLTPRTKLCITRFDVVTVASVS